MIKQTRRLDIDSEHKRIDALALALGFMFEDGAYVKAVAPKRPYTKRATKQKTVREVKASRAGWHKLPKGMYDSIEALGVGQEVDITEPYRATVGITFRGIQTRIANFAWKNRMEGTSSAHYAVRRENWRIYAKRTA